MNPRDPGSLLAADGACSPRLRSAGRATGYPWRCLLGAGPRKTAVIGILMVTVSVLSCQCLSACDLVLFPCSSCEPGGSIFRDGVRVAGGSSIAWRAGLGMEQLPRPGSVYFQLLRWRVVL